MNEKTTIYQFEKMLLQNLHVHVGHGIYPHLQHFSNKIFKIILYIRVFIV